MRWLLWSVVLCSILDSVHSVTHWMVTENGLSVQAQEQSPFFMAQPHSLVAFLRQQENNAQFLSNKDAINRQRLTLDELERRDDPDIEVKFRASNPHCLRGGSLTSSTANFMSTYLLQDEETPRLFARLKSMKVTSSDVEPDCSKNFDLPFSMYAFEHLESMQRRAEISASAETELLNFLPSRLSLFEFAKHLTAALQETPEQWMLLNLAAVYWRILGKTQRSIECLRRALHLAPIQSQAPILLNLANILHRSGYSHDAIIVYQVLLSRWDSGVGRSGLGDALVLIGNRTEALEQYERASRLDSKLDFASTKSSALKCDHLLETLMQQQHNDLLQVIDQKTAIQQHNEIFRMKKSSLERHMADEEIRTQASLLYDYHVHGHSLPQLTCRSGVDKGQTVTQCLVSDSSRYEATLNELRTKAESDYARQNGHSQTGNGILMNNENNFDSSLAESDEYFQSLRLTYNDSIQMQPATRRRYPLDLESRNSLGEEHFYFRDKTRWPSVMDCQRLARGRGHLTRTELPHLFISPENKGFILSHLLTKHLNLLGTDNDRIGRGAGNDRIEHGTGNDRIEHPLPWYPPLCSQMVPVDLVVNLVDDLKGVEMAKLLTRSPAHAEQNLRSELFRLVRDNLSITEAEIAQRLATAIKYNIGPKWILYNLAGLYWRFIGAPNEAIACLRLALAQNDEKFVAHDIALVQMAQILMITSPEHDNDAATLLIRALELDSQEPVTHFLLGFVRALQGSSSVDVHLMDALEVDPRFEMAVDMLRDLRCAAMDSNNMNNGMVNACDVNDKDLENERGCVRIPLEPLLTSSNAEEIARRENRNRLIESLLAESSSTVHNSTLPLDYGITRKSPESSPSNRLPRMRQTEIVYALPVNHSSNLSKDEWHVEVVLPSIVESVEMIKAVKVRQAILDYDTQLPDILPSPSPSQIERGLKVLPLPLADPEVCKKMQKVNWLTILDQVPPTWLSMTAKGVRLEQRVDLSSPVPGIAGLEPHCPELDNPSPLITMEHLPAYGYRQFFRFYKPEMGLSDAFQTLGNEKERLEHVAARLTLAMRISKLHDKEAGGVHWTLSTAATLYWRVRGDAVNALKCMRHALSNAPKNMTDVSFVSMANVYGQAGFLHSALISAGAALDVSHNLIVIHFTLANIYASMKSYAKALDFYYSTLALQTNFEPAKERIRAIFCYDLMPKSYTPQYRL